MKRPTRKEYLEWWNDQPRDQTCTDCGEAGRRDYVQPQHHFYADGATGVALCTDCMNDRRRAARLQRKAAFAARPRCEVDGCSYRGNWRSFGVLLCGRHLKRAKNAHARNVSSLGGLGLFVPIDYSREQFLTLAEFGKGVA